MGHCLYLAGHGTKLSILGHCRPFCKSGTIKCRVNFFFFNLKEHWNTKNKKASFSLTLEIQRITINTSKNGHLIIHTLVFAHADHKKCFAGHMLSNPTVHTVGTESIQTPLNFSLFVILQPFAKII